MTVLEPRFEHSPHASGEEYRQYIPAGDRSRGSEHTDRCQEAILYGDTAEPQSA
jgi:hypothetical protein